MEEFKQKHLASPIRRRDEVLRDLLKNEFQRRAERNPAFSLRALSKKIDIDQSLLSKILQGKRRISGENADRIAGFLGVYLKDMKDASPAPTQSPQDMAMVALEYELIKEDEFMVISEWHHFALLELIKTRGFRSQPDWIAERLGISFAEASQAISRLSRLGFIDTQGPRLLLKKPNNSWLDVTKTTQARRTLQKRLHAMSAEAIENYGLDEREHSSLIFSVDPSLLPEIKKRMTEFRRAIDKLSEEHGRRTEVFTLCVSLFPLTQKSKRKSKVQEAK